ncbi:PepSY-associated TM helix domain-containing protein [Vibrio sp. Of14-4]|uniref:PepSY-associated TM helix domain-containing protein n=1 Tax=Vibrio sp. Of14-4 TaxID=2724878 RepID=UPI001EF21085|nr:PepSY-associated TM helix domain-containing protein [Vibrio sp. Of14-4]MCG7488448.1 PepSY-associated TM helix domain-containing protein [Vibrio sp. Of14-4]
MRKRRFPLHNNKWLRRIHAWTGIVLIPLMLLYGITGLWLQHRSTLKIPGPKTEMINQTLNLDNPFNSTHEFKSFSRNQYLDWFDDTEVIVKESISLPTKSGSISIPPVWSLSKVGLNGSLRVYYVPETLVVRVKQQDPNFWAFMNRLHRGMGTGISWQFFGDLAALSLILFSLTGLFMWTKLHGTSRAGVALFISGIGATFTIVIMNLL